MAIRLMLADPHASYRHAVREMLERESDLEVAGEVSDGDEAVRVEPTLRPDLVIVDVAIARVDGIEATRQIVARRPDARVLALSLHSDPQFVDAMLRAGARGYVLKDDPFSYLLHAIHDIVAGGTFVSPSVAPSAGR